MKTQWENSIAKYNLLLGNLSTLIEETDKTLRYYQQANIDFAYNLCGKELIPIFKQIGYYSTYEENFRRIQKDIQDHLQELYHLRNRVHLMIIKDPANHPYN